MHFKNNYIYRVTNIELLVNGDGAKSIEDSATYTLSLKDFDEYEFENNDKSIQVKPYEINLSDAEVYHWTLGREQGSLLRTGYVDGNNSYYADSEENAGEDRTRVVRSIVRYRGDESGLSIMLNGGEIPDLFKEGTGKRTTIVYGGTTAVGAIGRYTATATLTLSDQTNYKYVGEITVADARGMTIIITDGKTAVITKTWYVASIDNGLVFSDGREYRIDNRVFGSEEQTPAPMLEHGNEMIESRVTFVLYTHPDLTDDSRVGEVFRNSEFGNYINRSMPSGKYYLKVSATDVSDGDGVKYQDFNRTFMFDVAKATLQINDRLNGKTFVYEYDGTLKLYGDDASPIVSEPLFINSRDRIGVWQNEAYNERYGAALITYHLRRWHDLTGSEAHEYVTATQLSNISPSKQTPREADTYIVYYRITAKNYENYGNEDKTFTVTVAKRKVELPDAMVVTYNGEAHTFTVPDNALYTVYGEATYINANEQGYDIALKLKDEDNYEWKNGSAAKLIVHKSVYDMSGVTIGNTDFIFNGGLHTVEVTGVPDGVTFTPVGAIQPGTYDIALEFIGDSVNYEAIPSIPVALIIRRPKLTQPGETGDGNIVEIVASAGFRPEIQLVVTEVSVGGHTDYQAIADSVSGAISKVYDVTLLSNGAAVQPDGTLTIKLLIPTELRGKNFKLFNLHGSEATDTEYTVDGNYAVVNADRLSEFIFVGDKAPGATDSDENNTVWIVLLVLLSLIIAGEIGFVVYREVRRRKSGDRA